MKCEEYVNYTVKEFATITRISKQTVYNKLWKGESLPKYFKIGSRILFSGKEINNYIKKKTITNDF